MSLLDSGCCGSGPSGTCGKGLPIAAVSTVESRKNTVQGSESQSEMGPRLVDPLPTPMVRSRRFPPILSNRQRQDHVLAEPISTSTHGHHRRSHPSSCPAPGFIPGMDWKQGNPQAITGLLAGHRRAGRTFVATHHGPTRHWQDHPCHGGRARA